MYASTAVPSGRQSYGNVRATSGGRNGRTPRTSPASAAYRSPVRLRAKVRPAGPVTYQSAASRTAGGAAQMPCDGALATSSTTRPSALTITSPLSRNASAVTFGRSASTSQVRPPASSTNHRSRAPLRAYSARPPSGDTASTSGDGDSSGSGTASGHGFGTASSATGTSTSWPASTAA